MTRQHVSVSNFSIYTYNNNITIYTYDKGWSYSPSNQVLHSVIKPVLSLRDCSLKDSEQVYWHKTNVRVGCHQCKCHSAKIPFTAKRSKCESETENFGKTGSSTPALRKISFYQQRRQVSFLSGRRQLVAPGAAALQMWRLERAPALLYISTPHSPKLHHYSSNPQRVVSQEQYAEPFGK